MTRSLGIRCGDSVENRDFKLAKRFFLCWFDPGAGNCNGCGKFLGYLDGGILKRDVAPPPPSQADPTPPPPPSQADPTPVEKRVDFLESQMKLLERLAALEAKLGIPPQPKPVF